MKFVDRSRTVLQGVKEGAKGRIADRREEKRREDAARQPAREAPRAPRSAPVTRDRVTPAPTKPLPLRAPKDYTSHNVEDRRFNDPTTGRKDPIVPATPQEIERAASGNIPIVGAVIGVGIVGVVLWLVLR